MAGGWPLKRRGAGGNPRHPLTNTRRFKGPMSCRACGLSHSPLMRCEVAKSLATNAGPIATNNEPATNEVATNTKTPNRRDRAAYNAYQREYMKRYRAGKKNVGRLNGF